MVRSIIWYKQLRDRVHRSQVTCGSERSTGNQRYEFSLVACLCTVLLSSKQHSDFHVKQITKR